MFQEAENRLNDAAILSQTRARKSDSNYLLSLLAFELLLKCLLHTHGFENIGTHKYKELFEKLPGDIQNKLIETAKTRMNIAADYSNFDNLLETWSANFINLRYPYEKYEGMSEEKYLEIGSNWIENGAKMEEATFVYYPQELSGMINALEQLVSEAINAFEIN